MARIPWDSGDDNDTEIGIFIAWLFFYCVLCLCGFFFFLVGVSTQAVFARSANSPSHDFPEDQI